MVSGVVAPDPGARFCVRLLLDRQRKAVIQTVSNGSKQRVLRQVYRTASSPPSMAAGPRDHTAVAMFAVDGDRGPYLA